MANNIGSPTRKGLDLKQDAKVAAIAKDEGKSGKGDTTVGGMTRKDLLGMASSDVPAIAKAVPGEKGGDLGLFGKASSTVPACAASAAKSGNGA